MSEKYIAVHEASAEKDNKNPELDKAHHEALENARIEAQKAVHEHAEKIADIRAEAIQHAKEAADLSPKENEDNHKTADTYWYNKMYQQDAYKQLLTRVQYKLGKTDRFTSKIIHQPIVEKVTEYGSRTAARPSGLLTGSIFAFIANIVTYTIARRNGYDMTYSVSILSFAGGFAIGIVSEYVYKGIKAILARP